MLRSDSSVNDFYPDDQSSDKKSDLVDENERSFFDSEESSRGHSTPPLRHSFCRLKELMNNSDEKYDVRINLVETSTTDFQTVVVEKEKPIENQQKSPTHVHIKSTKKSACSLCEKILISLCLFLLVCVLALFFLYKHRKYEPNVCLTEECVRTASSLLDAMDQKVDPCEDFFQYSCGSWNKKHLIPEDRSSISTFEVMNDQLQLLLKGLLERPILHHESQATKKAKVFYRSCMNTSQIQLVGDAPLKRLLRRIGGWPVSQIFWNEPKFSVEALLGILRSEFNQGILIDQWIGPDDKNSSVNVIQLDQMHLGLQSREMFLSRNSTHRNLNAYLKFMIDIAELVGATQSQAERDMRDTLVLETQFANATMPETERHDTGQNYLKLPLKELQEKVPLINWKEYLNAIFPRPIKLSDDEPIVVYAMPYFKKLSEIIKTTSKRTLWNYCLWRLVMELTPHLTKRYRMRRQDFRTVLLGVQTDRNRWHQCVEWTNKRLGMAVGGLFVKENFNYESKKTALEMIRNLRQAFSDLLEENEWMDNETRAVAREKANAMNEKIGYPDMILNTTLLNNEYNSLIIYRDKYVENILNFLKFEATKNIRRLRKAVDKTKWSTTPAVLNAFYNPNFNDIVFPASMLQPLFYSQHFPKSLNYGGIGVVIGHEMTHGFDDKGRQFDKDGNLKQWWNNRTIMAFRERAQCIIDQYSHYKIEQLGQYMNGRMTQGENIADNGGIKQAFRAYKSWVAQNGEEKLLPGIDLTHDQLFFLNYAQIWCGSMRPEDALMKIRTSVHSIGPLRVLGPLSNSEDFAKAYKCPPNSTMSASRKCYVW